MDDQLALQRPGVVRDLELAEPALAPHQRSPLVVREVRIAAERTPRRVDVLDRAEQRLHQVQAVDADVAERVARLAVPRRQRAALVRRVLRAAQDVHAHDVSEFAGAHGREGAHDLRIEQQRVVDGQHQAPLAREHAEGAGLVGVLGDRLLDDHVAASLERGARHAGVGGGRCEHVDHVGPGGDQRVEIGVRGGAPARGVRGGPRGVEIGDPDQLDGGREGAHGGDVELADGARADEAGAIRGG